MVVAKLGLEVHAGEQTVVLEPLKDVGEVAVLKVKAANLVRMHVAGVDLDQPVVHRSHLQLLHVRVEEKEHELEVLRHENLFREKTSKLEPPVSFKCLGSLRSRYVQNELMLGLLGTGHLDLVVGQELSRLLLQVPVDVYNLLQKRPHRTVLRS